MNEVLTAALLVVGVIGVGRYITKLFFWLLSKRKVKEPEIKEEKSEAGVW